MNHFPEITFQWRTHTPEGDALVQPGYYITVEWYDATMDKRHKIHHKITPREMRLVKKGNSITF